MKKIRCKPVTFGIGHSDPESPYNRFKSAIREKFSKTRTYVGKMEVLVKIYLTKPRSAKSDLDNYAKPVIDALHEAGVFDSESQIYRILMEKIEVSNQNDEGVLIEVNPLHKGSSNYL
jgi:Holliday junction resolvase RusA-like endonuclease